MKFRYEVCQRVGRPGTPSVSQERRRSPSAYPALCSRAPMKSCAGQERVVALYSPASWVRPSARLKRPKSTPNTSAPMLSTQSPKRSDECWTLLRRPASAACIPSLGLVAEPLHRGDIRLADLGPTEDPHPCVLLSRDVAMSRRRRAIVAIITSNAHGTRVVVP